MVRKYLPLARTDFENWLQLNRPRLRAYQKVTTNQVGFYDTTKGLEQSFRGFNTWQDAKAFLNSATQ